MADNMMKPLVTVIVPIFNGSKWISRCLDSLIYQTLKNIEIIAIDNGSTDNTWEILTAYSNKYAEKIFIKTIPHTNGPGGGRNVGLEMARANYIAFADIDDYFEYDAMESMYEKIVEGDYDIVYCASCDIKDGVIKKTRTLSTAEKSFVIQYGSMVFWNKLFKRDLFEKAGRIPEHCV